MDQLPQSPDMQPVGEAAPRARSLKIPLLLCGVSVIFLFLIGIVWMFLSQDQSSSQSTVQPTSIPQNSTTNNENALVMPKLTVANVTDKSTQPVLPETLAVYTLKPNVTTNEIRQYAEYLGLSRQKLSSQGYVLAYETDALNTKGIATFHKPTGRFTFESYGIVRPEGNTKQEIARSFLEQMQIADETVLCDITYTKQSQPDVTFVECHRDWERAGLPIYNIVGLLNSSSTEKIANSRLGIPDATTPADSDITSVSTGSSSNGKMRLNDFNTATIAIASDNSINSADSTIRVIEKKVEYPKSMYLTPEEAFQKFTNNDSLITIMSPAGSGSVDLQKVFQTREERATETVVTDFVLSYLETPSETAQELLTPMYTLRGEATLTTGYRVKFVATVPALRDGKSFMTKSSTLRSVIASVVKRLIPVVSAQEDNQADDSLQLRTFTPPPNPTREVQPTTVPTEPPDVEGYACPLGSTSSMTPVTLTIPGIGSMEVYYNKQHTYYLKKTNFPAADMNAVKDAFVAGVEEQYLTNVATYGLPPSVAPKTVFVQMNKGECPIKTPGPLNAPVFNCKGIYGLSRLEQVANSVSDKLIAARENGTLSQLANRPRIFPSGTKNLAGTLLDYTFQNNNSCYISGVSPALFLYSDGDKEVTVTLPDSLTYADPPAKDKTVSVSVTPDGLVSIGRNARTDYVYYEYNPQKVSVPLPDVGYSVKSSEVHLVVQEVAEKAGLTEKETTRLLQDVNNELFKNTKPFVRIGILTEKELNPVLPVGISPQPDVFNRLHLVLLPEASGHSMKSPLIEPVKRSGFYAIEVGARLAY